MPEIIYTTFPNKAEAKKICRILLKKKLIACANILPAADSLYSWQRKTEEAKEYPVILKTEKKLVKKTIAEIKKLHSYDCPCIVSWQLTDGNKEYLEWIKASVV